MPRDPHHAPLPALRRFLEQAWIAGLGCLALCVLLLLGGPRDMRMHTFAMAVGVLAAGTILVLTCLRILAVVLQLADTALPQLRATNDAALQLAARAADVEARLGELIAAHCATDQATLEAFSQAYRERLQILLADHANTMKEIFGYDFSDLQS